MTANLNLKRYLWIIIAVSAACVMLVFASESKKPAAQELKPVDHQIIQTVIRTPPNQSPVLLVTIIREVSADGRYHQVNIMPGGKGGHSHQVESYSDGKSVYVDNGEEILRHRNGMSTNANMFDPNYLRQMQGFIREDRVLDQPVWIYRSTTPENSTQEVWMSPKFGSMPLRIERVNRQGREILETISLTFNKNDPSIFDVPQSWIDNAKEK